MEKQVLPLIRQIASYDCVVYCKLRLLNHACLEKLRHTLPPVDDVEKGKLFVQHCTSLTSGGIEGNVELLAKSSAKVWIPLIKNKDLLEDCYRKWKEYFHLDAWIISRIGKTHPQLLEEIVMKDMKQEEDQTLLEWAYFDCLACGCSVDCVRFLIEEKKVNVNSYITSKSLSWLCGHKHKQAAEVLKYLLAIPEIDPNINNHQPLASCAIENNPTGLQILLADPRIDPNANNGRVMSCASNSPECLEILLKDGRINPNQYRVLGLFCNLPNLNPECIRLLVQDGRSNPNDCSFLGNPLVNLIKNETKRNDNAKALGYLLNHPHLHDALKKEAQDFAKQTNKPHMSKVFE